jgi:hypothetical protein
LELKLGLLVSLAVLAVWPAASTAESPVAHAAAVCADYATQAEAQRAADTRDPDGDGIYCESLPCPCSSAAAGDPNGGGGTKPEPAVDPGTSCARPKAVQRLVFSARKYPNIRKHFRAALRRGWPRVMVLNRGGADARRDHLLRDIPTRAGFDRDEYPAAVGRGKGKSLERGRRPRGWKADVRYVSSSENRSHGAALGSRLVGLCNGTRFRYVFR